jgi:hypothetical protein
MHNRYLLRVVTCVVLLAAMPLVGHHAAQAAPGTAGSLYGHNLVVNGDAESGPGAMNDSTFISPPGWKTPGVPGTVHLTVAAYAGSGLDLSPTTPGPANRGKNYFYGGPTGGKSSSASQRIDISAAATAIDSGGVTFTLSGWLGGYSDQSDAATLRATFLDATGKTVGYAAIGPVTATMRHDTTELLYRSTSHAVPKEARTVNIDLVMQYHDGSDNDGMADNLALVLTASAGQVPGTGVCATLPTTTSVVQLTPVNAAVEAYGAPVQFTWKAVKCAAAYNLLVWLQQGVSGQTIGSGSKTLTAQRVTGVSYTLPTNGWARGEYAWRVIATMADGSVLGKWSQVQTYMLK